MHMVMQENEVLCADCGRMTAAEKIEPCTACANIICCSCAAAGGGRCLDCLGDVSLWRQQDVDNRQKP